VWIQRYQDFKINCACILLELVVAEVMNPNHHTAVGIDRVTGESERSSSGVQLMNVVEAGMKWIHRNALDKSSSEPSVRVQERRCGEFADLLTRLCGAVGGHGEGSN
jgi:hypothetical protein